MDFLFYVIAIVFTILSWVLVFGAVTNYVDMWRCGDNDKRVAWLFGVFITIVTTFVSLVTWYVIYSGVIYAESY